MNQPLSGLSEKIFLDRYALKQADVKETKVGDYVLVLTQDDVKFPTKEVGVVLERDGDTVKVQLRNDDIIETNVNKLTLTIEKTPEEMWDRLAKAMASVEKTEEKQHEWQQKFRAVLDDWKLVPGGRIAAGAGASDELTLFNCYVIPSPHDSRGGIMETLTEMTEIMSRGGGVGINLSSLRPTRAIVRGVNGTSSGAVSWGGLFSYTTGLIEQGGSRRGALMLMINDWHPDMLRFITVKQNAGEITNANLSVCVSNDFMKAVKEDLDWELVFPDTSDPDYDSLWDGDLNKWKDAGKKVIPYQTVKAREVWHTIISSAWKSAEPGVVFTEYYNQMSNSWYFNPIICTNPCGEQGLPAWGVCNLSALNLSKFYDDVHHDVAWDELKTAVHTAVRFLDNVIDKTPYHFEENKQNQQAERRVGLGTMGLAELLIKLKIRYGSADSLEFLDHLYAFIAKESYLASSSIAAEKGSFTHFETDLFLQSGFMKNMIEHHPEVGKAIREQGMRNVTVITQAPTGSTGTMVGTSTGIEPYFAFEYYRQSRLGFDKQYVPIAQLWNDQHPDEDFPDYFVTAMNLSAEDHIRVQAAIQKWVDSSISKTANCPADFTIEDTKALYELAFDLGCKGVTIYRDGSRDEQVLHTTDEQDSAESSGESEAASTTVSETVETTSTIDNKSIAAAVQQPTPSTSFKTNIVDHQYKKRPQVLEGATYKYNTPFGMAYITINDLDGIPSEIFLNVGKAGSDVFAMSEALGRVCSLFLRYGEHGEKEKLLIKHLKGIGGSGAIGFGSNRVESIADAVAQALQMHMSKLELKRDAMASLVESGATLQQEQEGLMTISLDGEVHGDDVGQVVHEVNDGSDLHASKDLCPACGSASLINAEGCKTCGQCGYSKCS
ncbi:adenosylcobalamin-dependent ribonucleoside-diphosphate reductase [Longirhabdus pacifica]|uniref:adenosylcobalamin-dependent ribonucleoside-diphosphate reductase n=1 Tax=Longirhabdus pacifica TaxID=2305227 RepID=UPI0010086CE7|nr:adenosylcobalamin-dependent ribonucleoside-diphosphate reductase [Longirhabdus pacifica]